MNFLYVCTHVYIYIYAYKYICMYVCIYGLYVCMVCMFMYVCIYGGMYVNALVIYIYICIIGASKNTGQSPGLESCSMISEMLKRLDDLLDPCFWTKQSFSTFRAWLGRPGIVLSRRGSKVLELWQFQNPDAQTFRSLKLGPWAHAQAI